MPVYFKICWYFLDRSYIIKTSKKEKEKQNGKVSRNRKNNNNNL